MQILQWLFKTAIPESPKTASSNSTSSSPKLKHRDEDEKMKPENTVAAIDGGGRRRRHLRGVEKSTKLSCDDMILLRFIQRKDVSKSFFYHTLNLKGLRSFSDRSRSSENTRRSEEISGNKVLPFAESARSSSRKCDDHQFIDSNKKFEKKKTKSRCGKKGVSSRVKELMKWSSTAKVKNRSSSEATTDDDQVNNESPKISIRWEMEGCSTTTTTIYTTISTVLRTSPTSKDDRMQCADTPSSIADSQAGDQCATGMGNWITTDSEFVVLEL